MRQIVSFFTSPLSVALVGWLAFPTTTATFAQQPAAGAGYAAQAGQATAGQMAVGRPANGQLQGGQQPAGGQQQFSGQQQVGGQQQFSGQQVGSQQVGSQQVVGQAVGNGRAAAGVPASDVEVAVNPVAPFPPLNAEWQAYLDKVLEAWEKKTSEFDRFSCRFTRHQFDPTLAQNDAYTIALGSIKYMKPDQGLFKVEQMGYYGGLDKAQKPQYKENPQKLYGEYWICDGKYVHVLDQNEKKCTKYELPPAMRGNAIYLSPLPFLFGVKAQDIKTRYWIHPLPLPKDRTNEVWLEAFPRRADDAANYQKVQVVLDLKDFMPKGLIVFLPNWRPEAPHREVYQFDDRRTNETLLEKLDLFKKEFIPKELPKDWKVIVEPYQSPQAAPPAEAPRVASPPSTAVPLR